MHLPAAAVRGSIRRPLRLLLPLDASPLYLLGGGRRPQSSYRRFSVADHLWDTATPGKSVWMALGIPLARSREAVEGPLALNSQFKMSGVLALRYLRASAGTLAFTR